MKAFLTGATVAALLASTSFAFAAANLVTNGDFSNGLTGWNPSGNVIVGNDAQYQGYTGSGTSGYNQFAAFGNNNLPGGSIFQTLTTVIGQTYSLTFDYAGFGAYNGSKTSPNTQTLLVSIGNSFSAPVSVAGKFLSTSLDEIFQSLDEPFTFVATSTQTKVTFADKSKVGINADMLLANVSVQAVPGPEAGTGLAGLAMAGLGFWAYRRKMAAAA